MDIFLKTLTVIGFSLLGILLFILVLLLLILLSPIRYKGKGNVLDSNVSFDVHLTYLLHIFSLSYSYGKDEPLTVRIFGFRLKDKEKKTKSKQKSDKDTEELDFDKEDFEKEDFNKEDINKKDFNKEGLADSNDEESNAMNSNPALNTKSSEVKSEDLKKTGVYDKIKKYLNIINSNLFKRTFKTSKKKLIKILKKILPRKLLIEGIVGFDDPATTGNLLMITSVLYPVIHKHIHIYGDFNNKVIDIKGSFKGHITLLSLLITAGSFYFDKNIRKLIKLFKEV